MIGNALQKRLEVYEPRNTPCYREAIEWLNVTKITDTKVLAKNIMLRLPRFERDMRSVVPIRLRRRWLARQLELAAKSAQRSGE